VGTTPAGVAVVGDEVGAALARDAGTMQDLCDVAMRSQASLAPTVVRKRCADRPGSCDCPQTLRRPAWLLRLIRKHRADRPGSCDFLIND
jgi:hypothetical protein